MLKYVTLCTLGFAISCYSFQNPISKTTSNKKTGDTIPYAATITQEELKILLYRYASDEFEGRETGESGQKKAASYLRSQYQTMGVSAAKEDGDYFQKVPLIAIKAPKGHVIIGERTFPLGEEVLAFVPIQEHCTEIVYAGYGIETKTYSDYNNLEVKDKWVLIKAGEPIEKDSTYLLSGTRKPSVWSDPYKALEQKSNLAMDKGARGVFYFDSANFPRYKRYFESIKTRNNNRMTIRDESLKPFVFFLNTTTATALKQDIVKDHQPQHLLTDLELSIQEGHEAIDSENVIAMIRGSEYPQEYIVLSAHLDHIGIRADGKIYNGADDDGSGNVALLEIAEAFQKAVEAGVRPKRSIVFLHVTAEEKGLLGSQYYTDYNPVFPLSQTVANLNIDMIGRIDPKRQGSENYVYLIGSDRLSTELHQISEKVNTAYTQLELDYRYNGKNDPNGFYYRSDHYNFAKHSIPVIFYFNGTHEDYHRPSDTPDKINYSLLENRTRLIFHTAWALANRKKRITVDKTFK